MTDIVGDLLAKTKENELSHYGVLGMKWGVRRDLAAKGDKRAIKQLAKADRKWEKEINSTKGFINVNNGIADKMNGPNGIIAKHNNDPRWRDKDITGNNDLKLQQIYHEEFEAKYRKCFEEVTLDLYGESPSGNYTVDFDWDNGKVNVVPNDKDKLKHAASGVVFRFNVGADGKVVSIPTEEMKHAELMSLGEDALKHYGILGMKWGVRRPVGKDGLVKGSPKSDDYKEARKLTPRKQSSLSNAELRKINERLRLERENNQLQTRGTLNKIKAGTAIVGTILAVGTTITTAYNFTQSPAGQEIRKMILKIMYDKSKLG